MGRRGHYSRQHGVCEIHHSTGEDITADIKPVWVRSWLLAARQEQLCRMRVESTRLKEKRQGLA